MSSKKYPRIRDFSEIGKRIRQIRGNLSQSAFGNLFGVNQNTVSRWENGKVLSDEETLKKIAAYGGKTYDWLLYGDIKEADEAGESITIKSPKSTSAIHSPYLFAGVDINAMTQILEMVEELLSKRKKLLKPVRKALWISLLYDQFQTTGKPIDQATLLEFLRRVD